jgi:hypothetical protein
MILSINHDNIISNILSNLNRDPRGYRYTIETMLFARKICDCSHAAYEIVRQEFSFPSQMLLASSFLDERSRVSKDLLTLESVPNVIQYWNKSNDVENKSVEVFPIILAVDAVTFKPNVTVDEEGNVNEIQGLKNLKDIDLFQEFVLNQLCVNNFYATIGKMFIPVFLFFSYNLLIQICLVPFFTFFQQQMEKQVEIFGISRGQFLIFY